MDDSFTSWSGEIHIYLIIVLIEWIFKEYINHLITVLTGWIYYELMLRNTCMIYLIIVLTLWIF